MMRETKQRRRSGGKRNQGKKKEWRWSSCFLLLLFRGSSSGFSSPWFFSTCNSSFFFLRRRTLFLLFFFLLEHHYLVPLFSLYSLVFSSSTRSFILSFALFFLFIHDRIVLGSKLADRQTHIQERERERWGVDWGKSWGRWWYNWEKEWGASFSSTRHSFFEQNFTFPIFKGWTHTTTFLHTCYVCYVDVTCTVVCLKHKDLSLPSSLCILFIHGWNKVCGVCLCVFLLSYTLPFNGSDEDRNGKDRRGWWWRGWKGKKGFSVVVVLCTMFLPLFFFFLIPAQHPAF